MKSTTKRLGIEKLENRELFAVGITLPAGTTDLQINGSYANDRVSVSPTSTGYIVQSPNIQSCSGRPVLYSLSAGNYCLYGSREISHISFYGYSGNDTFNNYASLPVYADGGPGNDWLMGGPLSDVLHGGGDSDTLIGAGGADYLFGEAGDDRIQGGSGNDYIEGGNDQDLLDGGSENDTIWGDSPLGGFGNDDIAGGTGDDNLYGGFGNDWINGGPGQDYLVGGAGVDFLFSEGVGRLLNGTLGDRFIELDPYDLAGAPPSAYGYFSPYYPVTLRKASFGGIQPFLPYPTQPW